MPPESPLFIAPFFLAFELGLMGHVDQETLSEREETKRIGMESGDGLNGLNGFVLVLVWFRREIAGNTVIQV